MKDLEISTEMIGPRRDIALVRPAGLIDTSTVGFVSKALQQLAAQKTFKIVIDLQQINYISSAGWGTFIGEIRNIRDNHGDLKLCGLNPAVDEVYKILEFDMIIKSYRDVDEALRDF